jgi:hypothetical protein
LLSVVMVATMTEVVAVLAARVVEFLSVVAVPFYCLCR